MKILLDMNLSPQWVEILKNAGWNTIHGALVVIDETRHRARILPLRT